ncbi:glycosyltransferase family 4 protein [uncultured Psychroserpens sp.]|uniref:glycosyltransferase family 4 protein n=1 Tax=uncultured Psychroserpens sp. TaxID=255436 RepID=UPI00260A1F78|nr:glycosyltransferase family 4 protein [uncultured Psychroserpens sp.]
MKVLQIIDKLNVGGAERVAVDLTMLLHPSVSVKFLCLLDEGDLDEELTSQGIDVIYLRRENKFNPLTLIKLNKVLKQFDIIHIHSRHVLRYVALTRFLFPFFRSYKIVFHDHFGRIDSDTTITPYLKYAIRSCNAYVGVSQSLVNWARAHKLNGFVTLLGNIILNGSDNITNNSSAKIIVIGNFRPQKNYEFLVELIAQLPKELKIDLYGRIVDQHYYNTILKEIETVGVENQITLITNVINVSPLIHNYMLGLHCSSSETGPLVAIEYLSKQLPFVMYDTGEVAEVLKSNSYELIQSDFKVDTWKAVIMKLISNAQYHTKMRNKIQYIYTANYSKENYLGKCLSVYQKILNS